MAIAQNRTIFFSKCYGFRPHINNNKTSIIWLPHEWYERLVQCTLSVPVKNQYTNVHGRKKIGVVVCVTFLSDGLFRGQPMYSFSEAAAWVIEMTVLTRCLIISGEVSKVLCTAIKSNVYWQSSQTPGTCNYTWPWCESQCNSNTRWVCPFAAWNGTEVVCTQFMFAKFSNIIIWIHSDLAWAFRYFR